MNAQGEDVVAGIRTPQELTIKARKSHGSELPSLEEVMPSIFRELLNFAICFFLVTAAGGLKGGELGVSCSGVPREFLNISYPLATC